MLVETLVSELDALVSQGQIIDGIHQFFAEDVQTEDFDGTITSSKDQTVSKLNGFLSGIQKVNGIRLHQSIAGEEISMSEYTFDFDMKDGSHILWHEIIRRRWKDGKVIHEQYFKN